MKSFMRVVVIASVIFTTTSSSYGQASVDAVGGTNPHPMAVGGTNPHPMAVGGTNPHPISTMFTTFLTITGAFFGF